MGGQLTTHVIWTHFYFAVNKLRTLLSIADNNTQNRTTGPENSSNKTINDNQECLQAVRTNLVENNDNENDSVNSKELEAATTVECTTVDNEKDIPHLEEFDAETAKVTMHPNTPKQTIETADDQESTASSHSISDENPLELQKVKRKYNITRAKEQTVSLDDTLPDIESTETNECELPGATTDAEWLEVAPSNIESDPTLNQINKTTRDTVSMDDSLPLLEQTNYYEDLEALMAIENDQDNFDLVPIGGPPIVDIVKDLNEALGINGDLEIAMDNAQFIENQGSSVAPSSAKRNKTTKPGTPGSSKGTFSTKTHGIR